MKKQVEPKVEPSATIDRRRFFATVVAVAGAAAVIEPAPAPERPILGRKVRWIGHC